MYFKNWVFFGDLECKRATLKALWVTFCCLNVLQTKLNSIALVLIQYRYQCSYRYLDQSAHLYFTCPCWSLKLLFHMPSPGMFANAEGVSQRAPVRWSESVIGAAVCFPYVVALDESFITIHSMLDQQLKQTLSFRDGHILQNFEGMFAYCLFLMSTKRYHKWGITI